MSWQHPINDLNIFLGLGGEHGVSSLDLRLCMNSWDGESSSFVRQLALCIATVSESRYEVHTCMLKCISRMVFSYSASWSGPGSPDPDGCGSLGGTVGREIEHLPAYCGGRGEEKWLVILISRRGSSAVVIVSGWKVVAAAWKFIHFNAFEVFIPRATEKMARARPKKAYFFPILNKLLISHGRL